MRRIRFRYIPPHAVNYMLIGVWFGLMWIVWYIIKQQIPASKAEVRFTLGVAAFSLSLIALVCAQYRWYVRPHVRARRLTGAGRLPCMWCGYDLAALDETTGWSMVCPECGRRMTRDELMGYWRRYCQLGESSRE